MSSSSPESVCRRIHELRQRLEKMKARWAPNAPGNRLRRATFNDDWQQGWRQIVAKLQEIDQFLNRLLAIKSWQTSQPAILQFPPPEEGALSMDRNL